MSDTPRTDAATINNLINGVLCQDVTSDFARTLERELTAAIERAEKAEKQLTEMTAIAEELAEKLISLMYKLPREDCQCEFCVLLRRFEEIKEGIQ